MVLPVPVCAIPMTSRPDIMAGNARCWISVRSLSPSSRRLVLKYFLILSSSKVITWANFLLQGTK